jgi:SNF2 family DNA or RNA helicase
MKKLEEYQHKAVNFICEKKKCCLFLGMGMGKTVISLTAIERLLSEKKIKRALIIAPLRVCNNTWGQEIEQWEHLRHLTYTIATGNEVQRLSAVKSDVDITVINRENVAWLIKNSIWKWDCVIIDESSSFKNYASVRFKALKPVCKYVKYHVNLTGTPIPNGYQDLWSQIFFCDSGERLGRNITQFRKKFFHSSGFNGYGYTLNPAADEQIKALVSDICMTMNASDYITLPERLESVCAITMPATIKEQYKTLEKKFVISIKDVNVVVPTVAALGNKLMQLCNGAIYDKNGETHHIHDAKIDYLRELLEDNPNENVLISYNYKSDVVRLKKAFPEAVILGTNTKEVDDWNAGNIRILLAHHASAGHGLNLQFGGNVVIWFGMTWNLEGYQQFNARLLRRGQAKAVRIIHLLMKGTIDEKIYEAVSVHKAKTQSDLLSCLKSI